MAKLQNVENVLIQQDLQYSGFHLSYITEDYNVYNVHFAFFPIQSMGVILKVHMRNRRRIRIHFFTSYLKLESANFKLYDKIRELIVMPPHA